MHFSLCKLDLHEIEKLRCDSLAVYLFEDVVPLRGMVGIVDWRLNGMISALLQSGVLRAAAGETFLIPLRPRLPIEKLFGFGLGGVGAYGAGRVADTVRGTFSVLARAAVHSTGLMLPGRSENLYSLEEGMGLLRGILRQADDLDELVIADRFASPEKDLQEILGRP
jgi:hypothetical protein